MTQSSPSADVFTSNDDHLPLARIVWLVAVAIALILCALTLPTYIQNAIDVNQQYNFGPDASQPSRETLLFLLGFVFSFAARLIMGILIFARLHNSKMGLLISGTLITYALTRGIPFISPVDMPTKLLTLLSTLSFISLIMVYLIFPNGKFVSHPLARLVSVIIIVGLALVNILGSLLFGQFTIWVTLVLWLLLLALVVYRYRQTVESMMRQQIKWAAIGIACVLASTLLSALTVTIVNMLEPVFSHDLMLVSRIINFIVILLGLGGPLCLTIALLRVSQKTTEVAN